MSAALDKLRQLRSRAPFSPEHVAFVQSTGLDLARIFGRHSVVSENFARVRYERSGHGVSTYRTFNDDLARHKQESYDAGLDQAEGILSSARDQLRSHGVDSLLRGGRARNEGARVFISHGTETPALAKVERFLRTLGAHPIVVMREASQGMAVDDLVEKRLAESDCAIILATCDEQVGSRRQPRPNVLHEIGLAQQTLENCVIYLKEEGCQFPSNVSPKVWENFRQDNMEAAFEKITKELRAFELL